MIIKRIFSIIFCLIVISVLVFLFWKCYDGNTEEVLFIECIDGDTAWFMVQGDKVKVRLIGIDAPEIGHDDEKSEFYGEEAKEFACNILKNANRIVLEHDLHSDMYDKYHRMLAWVFVDDVLLNDKLVSDGYAEVKYIYNDYRYVSLLCDSQKSAFNKKIGIWNNGSKKFFSNYCYKKGF